MSSVVDSSLWNEGLWISLRVSHRTSVSGQVSVGADSVVSLFLRTWILTLLVQVMWLWLALRVPSCVPMPVGREGHCRRCPPCSLSSSLGAIADFIKRNESSITIASEFWEFGSQILTNL